MIILCIGLLCSCDSASSGCNSQTDQNSDTDNTYGSPSDNEFDQLRQTCVHFINQKRATRNLPPLKRATPEQEACSDRGAQTDADSGRAHASAGSCGLGAQNSCPGWGVGGFSAYATAEDALTGCLQMMWDEGPPPTSRCTGSCYMQHGHYINMTSTQSTVVSCGFYQMRDGKWWFNQDFGSNGNQ
jgi:hypothetical protein